MNLIKKYGLIGKEIDIFEMYYFLRLKYKAEFIKKNIENGNWVIANSDFKFEPDDVNCCMCDLPISTRGYIALKCGHLYCYHCSPDDAPKSYGKGLYLCKLKHKFLNSRDFMN